MQKVTSSTGGQTQQQGQCVQVSQAMIGSQPTAQIISPLQVRDDFKNCRIEFNIANILLLYLLIIIIERATSVNLHEMLQSIPPY